MKAELIEDLIIAHCSGDEKKFGDAVKALAADEEKKGNIILAGKIRKAYADRKKSKPIYEINQNTAYFVQSATPRDKDSLLELYEIIHPEVTLDDIILPESQKNILKQVIREQKEADQLLMHNLQPVNRILLCGPPGCGKTMTAYAIASELGLPVAYVRLDGLVSSYLGQTSTNLRKVFDSVRNQKIILFLDEFDAIAKKRDDSNELGELKRVVTTLLQNFDNLQNNVFLIAATNHEHLLDPAIWRRFNVTITLELPNTLQRKSLLEKWFKEYNVPAGEQINFKQLADISEGLNGAQIRELASASGKAYLLNKSLNTEDVTAILIRQLTKYSGEGDAAIRTIFEMNKRGVSVRKIGKALGIPSTTLDYQIKKYRENSAEEPEK